MIPQNAPAVELREQPSLTYGVSPNGDKIIGMVDGVEALRQALVFRLNTERGMYPIYSETYGIDLQPLVGAPLGYVIPELERRIKETLQRDERVTEVIRIEVQKLAWGVVVAHYAVRSVYGDIEGEVIVNV